MTGWEWFLLSVVRRTARGTPLGGAHVRFGIVYFPESQGKP